MGGRTNINLPIKSATNARFI